MRGIYNVDRKDCSLREMVEAMHKLPDETVFRWFQASHANALGEIEADETFRVTLGQARAELGVTKP